MKTVLFFVTTAILLPITSQAQLLPLKNVNAPGIYCRFNPDCTVAPVAGSSSFTPTNLAATCVLESRSFSGGGMDAQGVFGYEYRLVLNNNGDRTNSFAVNSLTLNIGSPQFFAFGGHASNQVWIVADGGPGSIAPSSAFVAGTNIVFQFNPPLVSNRSTNGVSTYFFGLISTNKPHVANAMLEGSTRMPPNTAVPLTWEMQARTP